MGRTVCTYPQCLCKDTLYLFLYHTTLLQWHCFITTQFIRSFRWLYKRVRLYMYCAPSDVCSIYVSYVLYSYFIRMYISRSRKFFCKHAIRQTCAAPTALKHGAQFYMTRDDVLKRNMFKQKYKSDHDKTREFAAGVQCFLTNRHHTAIGRARLY